VTPDCKAESGLARIILFNKPYGVLTQFTSAERRPTLKDYIPLPGVYAAGRLDTDSEGLLVLTDDGRLQQRISDPRFKQPKTYWAQVEGIPDAKALKDLADGPDLGDFRAQACCVMCIPEPACLWQRDPPIRTRKQIPTTWLEIQLTEGKNRQVRRMTAKVGFPTLRLIRWAIGPWTLAGLPPGAWVEVAEKP
jgi:23S rRNA pseudouridine2457 synthase